MQKRISIAEALKIYSAELQSISLSPEMDVKIFLTEILSLSYAQMIAYSDRILDQQAQEQLHHWVLRRLQQEPVAYIVGHQPFWTLDLDVNSATLIPRPETEHLVEWVLTNFPASCLKVADLGVGSGAIALSLAVERPLWEIDATDKSVKALEVAKRNAEKYNLSQVNFYLGDWCTALPHHSYHVIISNPPYISPNDQHLLNLSFEPQSALVAENNGIQDLQSIILQSRDYLIASGYLVLEHGSLQSDIVQSLLEKSGYTNVVAHHDFASQPRFVTAMWNKD